MIVTTLFVWHISCKNTSYTILHKDEKLALSFLFTKLKTYGQKLRGKNH